MGATAFQQTGIGVGSLVKVCRKVNLTGSVRVQAIRNTPLKRSQRVCTWTWMVVILVSFWDGKFWRAMLNFRWIYRFVMVLAGRCWWWGAAQLLVGRSHQPVRWFSTKTWQQKAKGLVLEWLLISHQIKANISDQWLDGLIGSLNPNTKYDHLGGAGRKQVL